MLKPFLAAATFAAWATSAHAQAPNPLPPGEGRDIVAVACTQCHAPTIIMTLREGAQGWRFHVNDMVLRGAQLTPAETDIVVDYLATVFGPGVSLPQAAKIDLPSGPGKDLVETRCAVCHDFTRLQGKRSAEEWRGAVAKMVSYGAPVTPDEATAITTYLQANFGG